MRTRRPTCAVVVRPRATIRVTVRSETSEPEKEEVLGAFAAHKGEVTEGYR